MENKYIITLEEMPFERFHSYNVPSERLYRVQGFNSLVFDGNGLSKLTPYTESNLEAIRDEAYEKGVQDTKQHWVDAPRSCAYRLGYENGLKAAWDAARKISTMDSPTRDEIFGLVITSNIIDENSASEAIEKIRQYEHEQEEIRVGDEVIGIFSSGEHTKPFVITKGNSDYYFGIYSDSGEFCQGGLKLQKTGRNFPEIAEVLKRMQEETA